MKLKFKLLPIAICIALLVSGCGKAEKKSNLYNDEDITSISTKVVANTSDSELTWDDENKCVILKNNVTNSIWSTIPYEYMQQGGSSVNVTSPINITVSDTDTLKTNIVKGSSGAVSQGRIIGEKNDNGVKVTYYFDNQKISIPVIYSLDKNDLVITLDSKNIVEASHYKLLDVAIAPFLCSASNSEENYLFVPSYNGALMNTAENTSGTRKYSGTVYGVDMAHLLPTPQEYESEIKMPVFAAKNGNNALFAIIESGAEHVTIEAEAGNSRTGWSAIWPKITVRGVDVIETQLPQATTQDISYVSELKINDDVKIRYIPLSEENANYNGMAKCYREYLLKNKLLENEKNTINPYSITVYGGAQINKLLVGVPYNSTVALTDYNKSLEIVKTLKENIGVAPEIQFIGFGESGINIGKVGGGFENAKSLGSEKEFKRLLTYLNDNGISYYFDYDIVRYNEASNGFSDFSDIAKTASGHRATLSTVDVALAGFTNKEYNLLTRQKLSTASNKLIKSASKKDIKGVSLNTLSTLSYSDYTYEEYVAKSGFEGQVKDIVNEIKQNEIAFSASKPNIYSALLANSVFDMSEKSDYKSLDLHIPFYQMVIGVNKSMYSSPINTSPNPKKQIMHSASHGLGLNFEVIGEYNVETDLSGYSFYGGVFEGQKNQICSYVKEYLNVFSKIKDAYITEYVMLNDQISRTVYSNGTEIYANHTERIATCSDIVLEGYEYKVAEE